MEDTPVRADEVQTWIAETKGRLAAVRADRRRYLALPSDERPAFARSRGFTNLTDITSTISVLVEALQRYERLLESLSEQ